jgi:maltooligosyltrehalose trehalohydrolase
VSFEQLKLAAATVILSPFQPMLFMGEEYGEPAPFQFFTSHLDAGLAEAVRSGRKKEFARFLWSEDPPDPQVEATFERCQLDHSLKREGRHRVLFEFYKRLIELRKFEPALAFPDRARMDIVTLDPFRAMAVRRWAAAREVFAVFHFGCEAATATVRLPGGTWEKVLDSADSTWDGPGSSLPQRIESSGEVKLPLAAHAVAVYERCIDSPT